jgi:PelA/Pel-15E family pectate lyase
MIIRFLAFAALALGLAQSAAAQSRQQIEQTMKRATRFMVEEVATNGGYVWTYLPDMSRRWGEMEAKPSMIWVQAPGTATMGHAFMDAYNATGDNYYYQAAERAVSALIAGQHRSGGWSYFIDFGGDASARHWYETTGRNGWRLEEFQYYSDNATFDDAGTIESMQLLLRLYVEKRDPRYRPALDKAINFVLESQYPIGGWPQRYPYDRRFPEYSTYITFNDDVAEENVRFLVMAYQALGDARLLDAINRGMNAFIVTQMGPEQPGWGLQYTLDLQPAGARTYEPNSLATHTTASNVSALMDYYELTGETKFLARIPEAIAWLESVRLRAGEERDGRAFPTFIELGTNRPLYVHRRGSNVVNGEYYVSYEPAAPIAHYGPWRAIDTAALSARYERLRATPPEAATRNSPLKATAAMPLPRYFIGDVAAGSDFTHAASLDPAEILRTLNRQGWWPTLLRDTTNPYIGPGPAEPVTGDFRQTHVGDASDASPYRDPDPVMGISTATYIANMARLVRALDEAR